MHNSSRLSWLRRYMDMLVRQLELKTEQVVLLQKEGASLIEEVDSLYGCLSDYSSLIKSHEREINELHEDVLQFAEWYADELPALLEAVRRGEPVELLEFSYEKRGFVISQMHSRGKTKQPRG